MSSSEIDIEARYAKKIDEEKRNRIQSNRESSRRSRLKRKKRINDLINEIATLKEQILEGNRRCNTKDSGAIICYYYRRMIF
ncbi:hypothetical protein Dsin_028049 [Dipteronia sinensis]|uniref:BZIP domain-containing protein n=1 Tax=Dipteronia sinensis TaxID=43782 RepID=A0AAD9ZPM4_9ROSI|nr:hypothetical protein Dsin_028049 [Dipteronia sinensis]